MSKIHSYYQRSAWFFDSVEVDGWKVKLYGMEKEEEFTGQAVLEDVKKYFGELIAPGLDPVIEHHGVGFAIVHVGGDSTWSILGVWNGGDMLRLLTYSTPFGAEGEFHALEQDGAMACVWEMAVVEFERQAWMKYAMGEGGIEAYLKDGYTGKV